MAKKPRVMTEAALGLPNSDGTADRLTAAMTEVWLVAAAAGGGGAFVAVSI